MAMSYQAPLSDFICPQAAVLCDVETNGLYPRPQKQRREDTKSHELLLRILRRVVHIGKAQVLCTRLMVHFGSFSGVVGAQPLQLRLIAGVTDEVISELKLIEESTQHFALGKVLNTPVLTHWSDVLDYCHIMLAHQSVERFHVLFLDVKRRLIADEMQGKGTIDHVPVYPREIVKRALELDAASLILVHNHPSGECEPSQSDIAMTQKIAHAAQSLNIELHDHLIIGAETHMSFRAQGLLDA